MNHNFDFKYPNVDVYDDDDNIVIPTSIIATSVNTLTATFGSAVAGVAIISTGGQAVDERGKNFVFSQETAATNWRVTHSIGEQYPAVTVYDEEDKVIIPDEIIATDGSKLDISFSEAIAGKVNVSVGGGAPTGTVSSSAQIATQLSGSWRGELSSSVYLRQVATTISGSLGSNATLIRSLTAASISGSRNAGAISGSFRGELSSSVYLRQVASTISGSTNAEAVSGSFRGELSSSVYLRQVEETVSGSWRGEFSSSALTNVGGGVSGSSVSTGSFGEVRVGGMSLKSLTTFSSSVATKLNSLDADIIALSIALG
jgi:HSP20 family molecular chaperone IbpA